MIGIDHFKNFNDTYGHQKGGDILLDFASTMKNFCRSNDVTARYGGEEFVLVLPEAKVKGAVYIAEQIREEMTSQIFQHKGKYFSVTVSCGIAEFDPNLKSPSDLIKVADELFYKAKHEGRNRTNVGKP